MSTTDPCFDKQDGMLSVDQAIEQLLSRATAITEQERVDLHACTGRVLAEDLASPIDVPGFDNSAMDGYALHSRDIATARDAGLPVTQRITAGAVGEKLQPGSAARIFTGAPLPEGADTVVMQELCRVAGEQLWIETAVTAGANIRLRGNDIAAGSTLLARGTLLQAAHLGLAASVGIGTVEVSRRLRVAVFSTGDELVEPGKPLAPGQIYNSNRYQLNALLAAQGCEVIDLGSIADDFGTTRETLLQAASQADQDGMPVAETYPRQGSDVLSSVAWADGLAEITEESSVQAGEAVSFLPFAE